MILKQQLQLQLQLLHFESDKPPAWWAMTELIEEEFSGPLVRSGIWQLETVHPSSVIPTDEVWFLKSERELQTFFSNRVKVEEEDADLIICLGKFPEPLLNLNLKTPVC